MGCETAVALEREFYRFVARHGARRVLLEIIYYGRNGPMTLGLFFIFSVASYSSKNYLQTLANLMPPAKSL